MRRYPVVLSLFLALLALTPSSPALAQGPGQARVSSDSSFLKPGRAPDQPVDEAYTKKIHEYTTQPFFLSPLVDYLPASKTVPTPAAVLGDIAGAPTRL